MRRILANPDPSETGADRLRQIGLMVLIHNLQLRSVDATTSKIEEISGTNRQAIYDITRALEEKGLLRRENIINRHNKGRVFKFIIPDEVIDPLAI